LLAVRYPVTLDARHLERLSGPLLTGVIELIWNAIDGDARNIRVTLRENALGAGGIGEIEVADDGHGIDLETAKDGFLALGRSWKANGQRSKTLGRPLHGKEGRGRFRLFRHGGIARWESVSELGGQRERILIEIRHGAPDIEIEALGPTDDPLGTRVTLSNFAEAPRELTGRAARDRLLTQFVLPIEEHGVTIIYDGEPLDPAEVRESRDELEVPDTQDGPLELTVFQWSRAIGHQDLYLCDGGGATLERIPSQVPAPGFYFTAYLRWDGFAEHLANLAVIDLSAGDVADVVGAARRRLEAHFDELVSYRQRKVISDWEKEGVYPFTGPPASEAERAARQTFDVVALEAAEVVNKAPRLSKRLSLRLLREALERNPGHVHQVLAQVLTLPDERLADLTRLLERTKLAHIISASRSIADRLDFLQALRHLTGDPEAKETVLERQQLHLILEDETWVFGEEYALAASDAGLTQVLEQHVKLLGRDHIAPGAVRDTDGRHRRIDLLLAQTIPHADNIREHLVVELKRPNAPIGPKELQQVKEYAFAVASDQRFDTTRTRWEFWAVSTEVKGTVERERRQRDKPFGWSQTTPISDHGSG